MPSRITTRHFELTDDVAEHLEARITRALRYFNHTVSIHVILIQEKFRYSAEIHIKVPRGKRLQAVAEAGDMRAAIDEAALRVEAQLRRFKERLTGHPKGRKTRFPEPDGSA